MTSLFQRMMLVFAVALLTVLPVHAQQQYINVLTGGTSGIYYPLGVALSRIYGNALPESRSSTQATKASLENLNLLQSGRGEIAFTMGDTLSNAWRGNEEAGFKTPLKKLRTVAGLYTNYIHIVASQESGIRTLADLKGKRVSVGAPRSGNMINAQEIFKAAGLSFKDFSKVEYLPFGESVELMKNRQLDATLQSGGLGMASIRDLASSVKIVFVPVPAAVVAKIGDPAYGSGVFPAKTYIGQDESVPTAVIRNFLATREDLPADTVYRMTKSMFENLDMLTAAHAAAKDIVRDNAYKDMPVPLHPGAERYYREVGLIK
jgi:TRAP transporter TAXI family solute receptor